MVDLVVTAANCLPGAGALVEAGVAGETITAGQALYKDASGNWMKADADSAVPLARDAKAISLNGAALGQPINVQKGGEITLGATMTPGTSYYLSGLAAGGICPVADVGTGEYFDFIGIAKSATVMKLGFVFSGVSA